MIKKDLSINIFEAEGIHELSEPEKNLVETSREMTRKAYAPYSGFYVGAALLLENGQIVTGSNQENGAYPSGLCAERVAAFAASSHYPGVPIKMIAVSAQSSLITLDKPVSPCGACRQVMLEYELLQQKPIKVLLSRESGEIQIIEKIQDLLPLSFSGSKLKKKLDNDQ